MDSRKLEQRFGWKSEVAWESGLADTVEWYRHNEAWVSDVRSGEYLEWIKRNYEGREAIG
jgi:dTDP-glucose 4,6-dehydratase